MDARGIAEILPHKGIFGPYYTRTYLYWFVANEEIEGLLISMYYTRTFETAIVS